MLFRKGIEIAVGGAPRQAVGDCAVPELVGLMGSDTPALHLKPLVGAGDRVALGDPVLADRARAELVVTAPAAGVIEAVEIGARRRVSLVTIRREGEAARRFVCGEGRAGAERFVQETGAWTAIEERPFGHVPAPGTVPDAIFIMAIADGPNAADPAVVLAGEGEAFAAGVALVARLTDGPVFLCQPPGPALAPGGGAVRIVTVAGRAAEALAGTQIDRHFPVTSGRRVWRLLCADVLALGAALLTGALPRSRVVALGGPTARDPRLVALPPGADIEALAAGEACSGPRRVLSGPALSGGESRFLRRRHSQVTLLSRPAPPPPRRRDLPPVKRGALVPHAAFERALGPRLPVLPLLRALSVGDVEHAERLGVLGLVEEDMALATYLSGGTEDFGARLREVLDRLEADR